MLGAALAALISTPVQATGMDSSTECLAKNMYFEARNQGTAGWLAVTAVVLNRVNDKHFPNRICSVITQGPTRPARKNKNIRIPIKHRCQFSWFCDGKSDNPKQVKDSDMKNMPMVAYLGFSIHGDEASGTEAAVLLLHHLAAGQGDEIDQILRNTILIIDPMFNPDGRDRFENWANGNRGVVPTTDTQNREHNQPWPRGSTNQYLFDLKF